MLRPLGQVVPGIVSSPSRSSFASPASSSAAFTAAVASESGVFSGKFPLRGRSDARDRGLPHAIRPSYLPVKFAAALLADRRAPSPRYGRSAEQRPERPCEFSRRSPAALRAARPSPRAARAARSPQSRRPRVRRAPAARRARRGRIRGRRRRPLRRVDRLPGEEHARGDCRGDRQREPLRAPLPGRLPIFTSADRTSPSCSRRARLWRGRARARPRPRARSRPPPPACRSGRAARHRLDAAPPQGRRGAELLQVDAGAERRALTREHDDAHRRRRPGGNASGSAARIARRSRCAARAR